MPLSIDSAHVVSYVNFGIVTGASGLVTCGAAVNRLLICGGADATGGAVGSGFTYNSVGAIQVPSGSKTNTQQAVDWYYFDNPPTGSALSLVSLYPANCNAIALLAIPLIGADLSRPPLAGTGTQGVPSASVACSTPAASSTDIAFAATMNRGVSQAPGSAPQTDVISPLNSINGSASFACSSIAGPNAGNFTWAITSGNWSSIGVTVFGTSGAVLLGQNQY